MSKFSFSHSPFRSPSHSFVFIFFFHPGCSHISYFTFHISQFHLFCCRVSALIMLEQQDMLSFPLLKRYATLVFRQISLLRNSNEPRLWDSVLAMLLSIVLNKRFSSGNKTLHSILSLMLNNDRICTSWYLGKVNLWSYYSWREDEEDEEKYPLLQCW